MNRLSVCLRLYSLFLLVAICFAEGRAATPKRRDVLTTYPAPKGAPLNDNFAIRVRQSGGQWQRVDAYAWFVDHTEDGRHRKERTSVATFAFTGSVEVEVVSRSSKPITEARVRPLSYGIAHQQLNDSTLRFMLDCPRNLSIEVNGDIFHNLQLFACAPEPQVKRTKDVIYFAPGYYDLGEDSIKVSSGQTLYLAGGAYVKGWASVYEAQNVRVIGHGIINPERQHEGIMVRYSRNVLVDGPITTQLPVGGSDSVTVRNAKVLSWYGWGDGMNVFASNNVIYNHVFCRTSDDCSTIYCTRKGYRGGCRNILVEDAVYWADVAHPIMIGLHGDTARNEVIEDVCYRNIDILDQAENQIDYQGCLAINNGDNITVRRVMFDDIRIERMRSGMLLNFRVCFNRKYCAAPGRGIHDIILRNIQLDGRDAHMSIMAGYNEERGISGVRFENLRINGKHISDTMPGKLSWYKTADYANVFVGEHVNDLIFE